jgi:hypothetical protein
MLLKLIFKRQPALKESFEVLRQETSSVKPEMTNCKFRGAMSPAN